MRLAPVPAPEHADVPPKAVWRRAAVQVVRALWEQRLSGAGLSALPGGAYQEAGQPPPVFFPLVPPLH